MRCPPFLAILGSLLVCGLFTATGHQIPGVNMSLIVDLTEEELTYELTVETSLLPPIQDVTFGTEPFPTVDERRAAIETYFRDHCPVVIDGIAVSPILRTFECAALENQMNLGKAADFVVAYLILSYPLKTKPQVIDMTWDVFLPDSFLPSDAPDPLTGEPHDPQMFDCVFYTYGELDLITFSPEEPQFIWHTPMPILSVDAARRLQDNSESATAKTLSLPLAIPLAALLALAGGISFFRRGGRLPLWQGVALLAGIGISFAAYRPLTVSWTTGNEQPDLASAEQRFKDLHQNIYRAFDYREPEQIYATLSRSVSGDLLDEVYQEVYKSLILREEQGAFCKVKKLEYINTRVHEPSGKDDFYVDCRWRVFGLVEHWQHAHHRVNEYEATYKLGRQTGRWKIVDVDIGREKRLDPKTLEAVN